jgi:Na+-driven multidrug efflux pump
VVLSIVFIRMAGLEGIAWAGAASAAMTTVWGYPLMMKRFLKRIAAQPVGQAVSDTPSH